MAPENMPAVRAPSVAVAAECPVTTFPAIGEATGLSDLDENTKHDIAKIVTELTVLSLGYNQMASKLPGNEGLGFEYN